MAAEITGGDELRPHPLLREPAVLVEVVRMRNQRDSWLAGLSKDEFASLSAWSFITHEESRQRWIAVVRTKLTTRHTDSEILSSLYLGLFNTVTRAIQRHKDCAPDRRGSIVIGSALAYIRKEGIAALYNEIKGSTGVTTISLEALCEEVPRFHTLEGSYLSANSDYNESVPVTPQFLAEEQAVADLLFQERHHLCESIKHHLTPREVQVMRLTVIDHLDAEDISEILQVSRRQVWKLQRELRLKLLDIAKATGVPEKSYRSFSELMRA